MTSESERERYAYIDAVVASEVKKSVLKHTSVSGGEYESVTVEPVRVLRVVPHDLVVQHVSHRSASHRQTRMAGVRLLHGVDGQKPDRVHRLLHQRLLSGRIERLHRRGSHGGASTAQSPASIPGRQRRRSLLRFEAGKSGDRGGGERDSVGGGV